MTGNNILTTASSLACPHGGTVMITAANQRAKAVGAPVATANATFTVVGCPFQLPPPTPSPCVSVQWLVTDNRVKADASTLSQASVGLCLNAAQTPQGPVVIQSTQTKVSSQ